MSIESEPSRGMASLIEAIAIRRDREAFIVLYKHFAPRVTTFLLRAGASGARAEELAQETMLVVWRKADLFVPKGVGAAAWIFTIARNLNIDAVRHESRISYSSDESEAHEQEQKTPEDLVTAAQMEGHVREALAQLSPEQIRVIELFFFGRDKTHGEIEKELQIPLGTVKSRLRLALGRLRALLDPLP